jgi:hypothetical protein
MSKGRIYNLAAMRFTSMKCASVSVSSFCCREHAVAAIERAWGVKLELVFTINPRVEVDALDYIEITVIEQVHVDELNGFKGVREAVVFVNGLNLDIQIVSALWGFVLALEWHMKQ